MPDASGVFTDEVYIALLQVIPTMLIAYVLLDPWHVRGIPPHLRETTPDWERWDERLSWAEESDRRGESPPFDEPDFLASLRRDLEVEMGAAKRGFLRELVRKCEAMLVLAVAFLAMMSCIVSVHPNYTDRTDNVLLVVFSLILLTVAIGVEAFRRISQAEFFKTSVAILAVGMILLPVVTFWDQLDALIG